MTHATTPRALVTLLLALGSIGGLAGCYGTASNACKLVSHASAPIGDCRQIATLVGNATQAEPSFSGNEALAQAASNDLAEQAAKLEASHLQVQPTELLRNDAKMVERAQVHGVAYACTGAVAYSEGRGSIDVNASRGSAVPPAYARHPRVSGPLAYLGSANAVPGCAAGQVYRVADNRLPDSYGEDAPAAELWGCQFHVSVPASGYGFAGAQAGAYYVTRYQGSFRAPSAGSYLFALRSGYPYRLWIDGVLYVSHERGAPTAIALSTGEHRFLLEYLYVAGAAYDLSFNVTMPDGYELPFLLGDGSVFYADQQAVHFAGAQQVGDSWRSLAVLEGAEIRITQQVHFKTDSAEIVKDPSESVLYAVAKTLSEHPEITLVEVQGHTDDAGTPAYNVELSTRRAIAVRAWLVNAGIAPHRLRARGYGLTQPLRPNTTEEGRALNRRVQFVIASGEPARASAVTGSAQAGDAAPAFGSQVASRYFGSAIGSDPSLAELLPPALGARERMLQQGFVYTDGQIALAGYADKRVTVAVLALAIADRAFPAAQIKAELTSKIKGYPALRADDMILLLTSKRVLVIVGGQGVDPEAVLSQVDLKALTRKAERYRRPTVKR
jgi:outer membrane protein OmpA-like peptidoglycan-associated protein